MCSLDDNLVKYIAVLKSKYILSLNLVLDDVGPIPRPVVTYVMGYG